MIFILFPVIIFICIAEVPPLIKNKQRKELITMGSLLGVALLLVIGKMLDIPSPIGLIDRLLSPLGRILFQNK